MSNYKWILDFGHGGMLKERYVTAPKKMHKYSDGLVIYEGVINRYVGYKLENLIKGKYDYRIISDPIDDFSLQVRVAAADNEFRKDHRCLFLSIHSNAGGGSGFEIFTSKGQTKSDKVAQIFCEVYKKNFPDFKFRNDQLDGDDDKEADFYVLRKTDCPAVLVENLFFDNRIEAEFLLSEEGQNRIVDCLYQCIEQVEMLKPI